MSINLYLENAVCLVRSLQWSVAIFQLFLELVKLLCMNNFPSKDTLLGLNYCLLGNFSSCVCFSFFPQQLSFQT